MYSKFLDLTEKTHLIVYQLTIIFTLFFYTVLKFATGHKFKITKEELIYAIVLFLAFLFSGIYKERLKFGKMFNKTILYLLLIFALITFFIALYFFGYSITFDYEFWESPLMILFTGFILPIIFMWCNFYLIKNIVKKI